MDEQTARQLAEAIAYMTEYVGRADDPRIDADADSRLLADIVIDRAAATDPNVGRSAVLGASIDFIVGMRTLCYLLLLYRAGEMNLSPADSLREVALKFTSPTGE